MAILINKLVSAILFSVSICILLNSITNGTKKMWRLSSPIVMIIIQVFLISTDIVFVNEIAVFGLIITVFLQRPPRTLYVIKILIVYIMTAALFFISLFLAAVIFYLIRVGNTYIIIFIRNALCIATIIIGSKQLRLKIAEIEILCEKHAQLIISLFGIITAISFAIIHRPYTAQNRELNQYVMLVICICLAILLAWLYGEQIKIKRQQQLKSEIQKLDSALHKSQEIVPAVKRELVEIKRKIDEGTDKDLSAELAKATKEVEEICTAIEKESWNSFVANHPLQKTGLLLLDNQLSNEKDRAASLGIYLDNIVIEPVSQIIRENVISQWDLQQAVGDLVRNAIRAAEKSDHDYNEILITFGRTALGYQIQVFDSGVPFPDEILKHLGERGNTTDGTGNGIHDLIEIITSACGSLIIERYSSGRYTKSVAIRFDGMAEVLIIDA